MKELLIYLGMMTENAANTDSKERGLLYDMWKMLRGEKNEEVNLEDVKIVILAILRMHDSKRMGHEGFSEDVGFFNEKD